MPERAGTELVFPAVQTYPSGEVVCWIEPPDAELAHRRRHQKHLLTVNTK
jgi:hypothetical protein